VLAIVLLAGAFAALRLSRRGVLGLGVMRARATNLVATRGAPNVWLVAHLDSKSQPVRMLVRVAGIIGSSAAMVVVAILAGMSLAGTSFSTQTWMVVAIAGALMTLPVVASTVGSASPGAVDDASGVVTVLRSAALLPRDARVGVVLTSAEELGMAGARAFAARRERAIALNVDGVDDRGTLLCMVHGGGSRARDAIAAAGRSTGATVRFGSTIPGILTDGVALAQAGWSAVTMSRGTLATLSRIHGSGDDLRTLRGEGIEDMARLVAAAAREII
jgi:hypothetical protein